MSEQILTHEYLRECLHYSLITGEFYAQKATGPRSRVGSVAGWLGARGYRELQLSGKSHLAHRLAWFWVTGKWPVEEIDHKNGIKNANYWLNLREATRSQNQINKSGHPNNTSGSAGVHWCKTTQKWIASISLNRRRIYLGGFDTIESACVERQKAEKEMHGEFARPLVS